MADGFRWNLTWIWTYPDPDREGPGLNVPFRRTLTVACPPQVGWMLDGLQGCDGDDQVAEIEEVTLHVMTGEFDVWCAPLDYRDIPGVDMESDVAEMTAAGWTTEGPVRRFEMPVSPAPAP